MSKLEKLKEKARSLEAKDPKGAIEAWQHVLKGQEEEGDPNPDLAVFNRIGDLYLKVREPAQAADYYDQAVDKYAELGFHNNAIAMCNKVLRNAPGRQTTYLKLAKLYASKGFMAGQAEFRRVCRADAQGWQDPARLRRPEGVRRHLGGQRTPAPDAGSTPAHVRRSGQAPRRWSSGSRSSRGAQASTA